MSDLDSAAERDPLFWWHDHPVRAAAFLVIVHTVFLLLCTISFAAGHADEVLRYAVFSTSSFLHGAFWSPLTYGFVHPPGGALWFAVEMYMLWVFGGQVEHFFGKRIFLRLYGILWLLSPLTLLALAGLGPQATLGSSATHFAIFIAFAALYPSVPIFFGIAAKWIATILVAVYTVVDVANREFVEIICLWFTVGAAVVFVRWERGQISLPSFRFPRRGPKLRVLPRPTAPPTAPLASARRAPLAESMDDIDALLDKIARTGLNSLSPDERARLERASADLKKGPRD